MSRKNPLIQQFENVPKTQSGIIKPIFDKPALPSTASFLDFKEKVPIIVIGDDTSTSDTWKSVLYPDDKRFSEAPTLLVRASSVGKKFVDIDLPTLPAIPNPQEIDLVDRVEWGPLVRDSVKAKATQSFGDWYPFNWMRDAIVNMIGAVGWALGGIFGFMYNEVIYPKLAASQERINAAFQNSISYINNTRTLVRGTINSYVDKLAEMWKLPSGAVPVVVEIRNETKYGFQWKPQASGQKIHFLAYGLRA